MKKFITFIIIICCIVVIGKTSWSLLSHKLEIGSANKEIEQLSQKRNTQTQANDERVSLRLKDTDGQEEDFPKEILAQYQDLYDENPDLVGWIEVEDTIINYPVMQSPEDPTFYLHANWEKNYSVNGLPLINGNCTLDSENILIYAHNMNDGSMFGVLNKYKLESYYKEHPIIKFDTIYEPGEYQIIGVVLTKVYTEDETPAEGAFVFEQCIELDTKEDFDKYVSDVKNLSLYETGYDAEYGDKLITLITCHYHETNGRLIVVAKKVQN